MSYFLSVIAAKLLRVFYYCARQLNPKRLIYDLTWKGADRQMCVDLKSTCNVCFSYHSCSLR